MNNPDPERSFLETNVGYFNPWTYSNIIFTYLVYTFDFDMSTRLMIFLRVIFIFKYPLLISF